MGTWYCDNEECGKPFYAHKAYKCENKDCECQDARGRVACSKKCHDSLFVEPRRKT